jgi:predicted permease
VIIGGDLWKRKFNSDPDILGKGINLDDRSYTIVGVMAENFNFRASLFREAEVYVPLGQWNNPALQSRGAALALHGIGRMKPGVTIQEAQSDLERIMNDLAVAYPNTNAGNNARILPLKSRMIGRIGVILWPLLGAVGFVLLIACVNVSNLLLARSTGRTREFAIRSALGATRWRLVRQSLTEGTLLALMGGAVGLAVAAWGTKAALAALPATVPRAHEITLDGRVLLFTIGISLLTGVLSGLAPALKASRWELSESLKESGRAISGRLRAQSMFVAVEMGLALVLLIGAGLMIRSLSALWTVDPGFKSEGVITMGLNLPPSMRNGNPEVIRSALRDISDRVNSSPGIRSASFSYGAFPLADEDDLYFWRADKPKPANPNEMGSAILYIVEPSYLETMQLPLKQGRFFSDQDNENSPAVCVIDQSFAQQYFPQEDPVGKRIYLSEDEGPLQIVGVVGHVMQWSLATDDLQELQSQLYVPFRAMTNNQLSGVVSGARLVARSEGGTAGVVDSIRRIVQSQYNDSVIGSAQTMNEILSDSLAARRFSMVLLNSFAIVALLLASVGLYGVVSYLVGQRTRELGIRLALGATKIDVLRMVLGNGMKMAVAGIVLGLLGALQLTELLEQLLFGVAPIDPTTFAVIPLLLMLVALFACFVPARRATRVDPLVALRHE